MRLKDKVALITGGSKGIGRETALLFAREGAALVLADIDQISGDEVVAEITRLGGTAVFYRADVCDRTAVNSMVEDAVKHFGRIDILINNAGITRDSLLTKMDEAAWNTVININLTGVFTCTQAVAPIMMQQGSGSIISASSVVGVYGNIGQTNYAATKAGVIGMTKSWAKELGRKGIRVNAIAPGFIVSDMTGKVPEKVMSLMREKTPLGRLGTTTDVAKAYLFLASDESSFINGEILSVDGGLVI